jgi:Protein of unknown function (DUF4242)
MRSPGVSETAIDRAARLLDRRPPPTGDEQQVAEIERGLELEYELRPIAHRTGMGIHLRHERGEETAPGGLGTFCIYQASSEEKIREHAQRADLPATEIWPVVDVVIVRPDPVAAAA